MKRTDKEVLKEAVRKRYDDIARCCGQRPSCCCGGDTDALSKEDIFRYASQIGYSDDQIRSVPEEANLGLGCGNPAAIASLKPGETVLDLGCGGGFDCFIAARQVGPRGRVIGVDMTPEMVSKARKNAHSGGYKNVEFRLGEIEHLPVADASIDVVLSNCVINLSPDKPQVFRDAHRVLKTGGRLAISDVVATAEIPEVFHSDLSLYAGCIAGAATIQELERMLHEIGFKDVRIEPKEESREFIREWSSDHSVDEYIASATIQATKVIF
ncbi:MAG: arsenite methyltransferase [Deltaproteobacteria bacterium]|nr:arsenite methyltransferase [Deltaproteobacteria bacterium]